MTDSSAPQQPSGQPDQTQTPSGQKLPFQEPGFFGKQVRQAKLFARCFKDSRVNLLLKLAYLVASFVAVLIYWVVPDFIPGPLDDLLISPIAIPLIFSYVFTELSPKWVVNEHRQAIDKEEKGSKGKKKDDPVENEFREEQEKDHVRTEPPKVPDEESTDSAENVDISWLANYAQAAQTFLDIPGRKVLRRVYLRRLRHESLRTGRTD